MVFLHSLITCLYVGADVLLKVLRLQHEQVYFKLHAQRQNNSEKWAIAEGRYSSLLQVTLPVGSISAVFSGPKSAGSLPETAVGNRAYLNSI